MIETLERPPGYLTDWLLRKGRLRRGVASLLDGFCRRTADMDIPLWRMLYVVQTLHPLNRVAIHHWEADRTPRLTQAAAPHGSELSAIFFNSPVRRIFEGAPEIRRRLEGDTPVLDYPILKDLLAAGATDYLLLPVPFSDGNTNAISLATKAPGGFRDSHIEELRRGVRALIPLLELRSLEALSDTLLNTYLGENAGRRVLRGAITRGSGETISSLIWYCDLRGFTHLSETLAPHDLIELLNDYFAAVGEPIIARDGEILKFVGDAVLAIFTLGESWDAPGACRRALDAAHEAIANVETTNVMRRAAGKPELRFGIAMHLGEVTFGNIGAPARLDFTVIGPAVNLTTRIEALTKELHRPILMSADVAANLPGKAEHVGTFRLKGIDIPQSIFAPRD